MSYTKKATGPITGYYSVNGVMFNDKISALAACSDGQWPEWHFMEDTYGFDWTQEPIGELTDWYRARALQLRAKYDRILLLFSGGIDSINVLRTFVDNNIPLEGLVSYGSFGLHDHEKYIHNQEIVKVAIPYVQQLQRTKNIKLDHYLLDERPYYNFYDNDTWTEDYQHNCYSPETGIWTQLYKDPWILNHCEKGKTLLLRGIDKPRLVYEDNQWKLVFLDISANSLVNPWVKSHDNLYYDFFFWSTDMPEIMCKQAHMIKQFFDSWDKTSDTFVSLFSRERNMFSQTFYNQWIDPIIYKQYLTDRPGDVRSYFSVGKPNVINFWEKEDGFVAGATDRQKENWKTGIAKVASKVDPRYYNSDKLDKEPLKTFIHHGLTGIFSKSYIIGNGSRNES